MMLMLGIAAVTAVAMEGHSALIHHHLWHKSLWWSHASHHRGPRDIDQAHARPSTGSRWEFNDIFALLHAAVAAPLIYGGLTYGSYWWGEAAAGVGFGMSAFGLAYALVHDGLTHGRLPVSWLRRNRFLWRVAAAHRVHHRTGAAPYGLFSGPWRLRRDAARRTNRRLETTPSQRANR